MNKAKISLSKQEIQLVSNTKLILTKNRILLKSQAMLEKLQEKMIEALQNEAAYLPPEIFSVHPKISKGENYRGLPYLVLDCPRLFKGDNIFAIRTMFWWGNFFSITLQLSGVYKKRAEKNIMASWEKLKKEKFFIAHSPDQWVHHFEKTNYLPVRNLTRLRFRRIISNNTYIKLAKKFPLHDWNKANKILWEEYRILIELIKDQLPSR
jgi:hypothetical protein